jgi:CMP-N-acetylneuraminic acid synthetase
MKKKSLILICARSGSKGLKNKNIKIFHGKPLIYYAIEIARKINKLNETFVSSDSEKILNISKKFGINNLIKRKKNLSLSSTPELEVWKDFIKKNKIHSDILIVLPITSPLRMVNNVKVALKKMERDFKKYDFIICASKSKKNPYFNMIEQKNKKIYELVKKGNFYHRQKTPAVFDVSTVCYIVKIRSLIEKNFKSIFDGKIGVVEIPFINSIDIDDQNDFEIAKFLYKKYY